MKLFAMLCLVLAWPAFCDATYILEDIDDGTVIKVIIGSGLQLTFCDTTGCVPASFDKSIDKRTKIKFAPPYADKFFAIEFLPEELHDLLNGDVIGVFYWSSDQEDPPKRAAIFLQQKI
jgi:hypothetical protein